MQQLASKNYSRVEVYIRDTDQPFIMPVMTGTNLMDWLTSDKVTKHVSLTDIDGNVTVELITNIIRVVPVGEPKKKIEEYI